MYVKIQFIHPSILLTYIFNTCMSFCDNLRVVCSWQEIFACLCFIHIYFQSCTHISQPVTDTHDTCNLLNYELTSNGSHCILFFMCCWVTALFPNTCMISQSIHSLSVYYPFILQVNTNMIHTHASLTCSCTNTCNRIYKL